MSLEILNNFSSTFAIFVHGLIETTSTVLESLKACQNFKASNVALVSGSCSFWKQNFFGVEGLLLSLIHLALQLFTVDYLQTTIVTLLTSEIFTLVESFLEACMDIPYIIFA